MNDGPDVREIVALAVKVSAAWPADRGPAPREAIGWAVGCLCSSSANSGAFRGRIGALRSEKLGEPVAVLGLVPSVDEALDWCLMLRANGLL